MVKHKITRGLIEKFFSENEEGTVYDIEDFMIGRHKNIPTRRTISGIMNKDPRYKVIRIERRQKGDGSGSMVSVFALNEEVLDAGKSD